MKQPRRMLRRLCLVSLIGLPGCVLIPEAPDGPLPVVIAKEVAVKEKPPGVSLESKPIPIRIETIASPVQEAPGTTPVFQGQKTFEVDDLVREVLKSNPTILAMASASEAARAKYPQAIALDDPNLGGWFAPGSIGSNQVNFALRMEYSQKLPASGKRQLRGEIAQSEANVAEQDLESMRLQLAEESRSAFYDYHLVERAMEVNRETLKLLEEFRLNAETRYRNGQTPQQDVLQAEVEISMQKERSISLRRMRQVARARINTLLHLEPDLELPLPGKDPDFAMEKRSAEDLRLQARSNRPDLRSLEGKIRGEEAAVQLARREFAPDYEAMAAYDSFWQGMDKQMQYQVGLRLNLPTQRARRYAALSEAQSRLAQRKAEYSKLTDQVNFQVQESFEQVQESAQILELFKKSTLPASQNNVREAQSSYINGKVPFLVLITAQKELALARDRYFLAQAEAFRRKAMLDRVTGQVPVVDAAVKPGQ